MKGGIRGERKLRECEERECEKRKVREHEERKHEKKMCEAELRREVGLHARKQMRSKGGHILGRVW